MITLLNKSSLRSLRPSAALCVEIALNAKNAEICRGAAEIIHPRERLVVDQDLFQPDAEPRV
jgi:hypothetical protein